MIDWINVQPIIFKADKSIFFLFLLEEGLSQFTAACRLQLVKGVIPDVRHHPVASRNELQNSFQSKSEVKIKWWKKTKKNEVPSVQLSVLVLMWQHCYHSIYG